MHGWTILTTAVRGEPWGIIDKLDPVEPETIYKVFQLGGADVCHLRVRPSGEVLVWSIGYVQLDPEKRAIVINPPE